MPTQRSVRPQPSCKSCSSGTWERPRGPRQGRTRECEDEPGEHLARILSCCSTATVQPGRSATWGAEPLSARRGEVSPSSGDCSG